jgi:hypothetical protein
VQINESGMGMHDARGKVTSPRPDFSGLDLCSCRSRPFHTRVKPRDISLISTSTSVSFSARPAQ